MKKRFRLISILLALLMSCSVLTLFSGCFVDLIFPEADMQRVYGDFIYSYISSPGSQRTAKNGQYVVVRELTDEGEEKDVIVVPEEIDGKKVVQTGFHAFAVSDMLAGKYSKIYLQNTVLVVFGVNVSAKAFFLEKPNEKYLKEEQGLYTAYVSIDVYEELKEKDIYHQLCPGNVTYIVDGEIYGFDDADIFITKPDDPIKEGYQFAGWYKDSECTDEWDFENDKVPTRYTEDFDELGQHGYSGEPIYIKDRYVYYYNETRLYAKWIKE